MIVYFRYHQSHMNQTRIMDISMYLKDRFVGYQKFSFISGETKTFISVINTIISELLGQTKLNDPYMIGNLEFFCS